MFKLCTFYAFKPCSNAKEQIQTKVKTYYISIYPVVSVFYAPVYKFMAVDTRRQQN